MPDQHCPTCGAARATGCGCLPDPSLTETAVLPHLEGPPLVRPYVSQTPGQVVEEYPAEYRAGGPTTGPATGPTAAPAADPFATTVLPPLPPTAPPLQPGQPGQSNQHPGPDGYATTLLPPVPAPEPPPGEELGFFPFDNAPYEPEPGTEPDAPGGRAARRAAEQADRSPLARHKGLLAGVGALLVALTIGVAYAVTPSSDPDHRQAQPLPTTTLAPSPVDPPTTAAPTPSAQPTTEAPSPTATPTRKPSPTRTATPTPTHT
ncbi:hypothetical protein VM95_31895, partial [Streptomyces rubellomurinus]